MVHCFSVVLHFLQVGHLPAVLVEASFVGLVMTDSHVVAAAEMMVVKEFLRVLVWEMKLVMEMQVGLY
jgi:hypothetical protein